MDAAGVEKFEVRFLAILAWKSAPHRKGGSWGQIGWMASVGILVAERGSPKAGFRPIDPGGGLGGLGGCARLSAIECQLQHPNTEGCQ